MTAWVQLLSARVAWSNRDAGVADCFAAVDGLRVRRHRLFRCSRRVAPGTSDNYTHAVVQCLGRYVSTVGPDDRADLRIDSNLPEEFDIPERLEDKVFDERSLRSRGRHHGELSHPPALERREGLRVQTGIHGEPG